MRMSYRSLCLQLPSTKLLHGFDKIWYCLPTQNISSKFSLYSVLLLYMRSPCMSVNIVTRGPVERPQVRLRLPARDTDFPLLHWGQSIPRRHKPDSWGLASLSSKLKQLGSVADRSSLSSGEARMCGILFCLFLIYLVALDWLTLVWKRCPRKQLWLNLRYSVAFSPQANYTDRATAACGRS
jgi:hypothetical protein